MSKTFLLFDGRAKAGLIDDAFVMDTASTEAEARRAGETDWVGHDAIWAEIDDKTELAPALERSRRPIGRPRRPARRSTRDGASSPSR